MYSTKLMVPFFKQFHPDLVIDKLDAAIRICGRWRFFHSSLLLCW